MYMRTVDRFEHKYLINISEYYQIKNQIMSFMDLDTYTLAGENQKYLVKSLYYDSHDFRAYQEKCYGGYSRIKLRIRSYSEEYSDDIPISVELKTRLGMNMKKYSVFVTGYEYRKFMETGHWPNKNKVLIEFERLMLLNHLSPKTLVRYRREGLIPKDRENFRVTFDHSVESVSTDDLFPDKPIYQMHDHHKHIVLEIKSMGKVPHWMQRIVQRYGLNAVANSKYGQSIELTRRDIVMPSSDHMISSFYSMQGSDR